MKMQWYVFHSIMALVFVLLLGVTLPTVSLAQSSTPLVTIREFAVPFAKGDLFAIAAASDGSVWFGNFDGNSVSRISSDGTINRYDIPTAGAKPGFIAPGPDNTMWFGEQGTNKLGRITLDGKINEYEISVPAGIARTVPNGLVLGPNGNVWFTAQDANLVGQITPAGNMAGIYSVPTPQS